MNNLKFKELVHKNVLIPSHISRKIINFINLNNENYLDTKISKYLTLNKLIKIKKNFKYENLYRGDYKYDLLIPIKYNFNKPIKSKGSCIFIHLTKNYKPTAGCIALKKKDFLIMLKIINKRTKIKIY